MNFNVKYVTKHEVAEMVGCSVRTVDRLRKQGLPCKVLGGIVRFNPEKVEEWIESLTNEKTMSGRKPGQVANKSI